MKRADNIKNSASEAGKLEYKRMKSEIDRKCRLAKKEWLEDKCRTVEGCINRGKIDTAYKKIKEIFGDNK